MNLDKSKSDSKQSLNFFFLSQFGSHLFESLILAQGERWRRALCMQVKRTVHRFLRDEMDSTVSGKRVSNTLESALVSGITSRKRD